MLRTTWSTNRELHDAGYKVHAVIVRPNRDEDLNEHDILKHTGDTAQYIWRIYVHMVINKTYFEKCLLNQNG